VLRTEGPDPSSYADHQRVPHWETGADLGILDLERGAKVSGSMFTVLRGDGATFSRALCQLALDRNADRYEEIRPPSLVRTETLTASGQLPKFADDSYLVERDDLWAIATSEIPLASLYRDEVLDEADLPKRFMAYSPCFRREAGSAGRDTRGLLRVHEFDKVELFAITTAAQAPALFDEILERAEARLAELGVTYRLLEICTGDFGQAHHRSIDLEVYAPGVDKWLEVSSVSWVSDYQARRANLRYRPAEGSGTELLHTLNGSALAVPRLMAALLETHRRPDGTVTVPEALRPYMRGVEALSKSSLARG
jgi:seryl-tRNA synthetase